MGRTGGRCSGASPATRARPCAGRQHHDVGRYFGSVGQHHAVGTPSGERNLFHRRVLVNGGAGAFGSDAQCGRKLAVVDLMVLRRPHRARELAGEMRLAPAGFGRGNPLDRQAELLLMRQVMVRARLIVGGQRHDQRALLPQLDVDAGRRQQFGGEGRPARLALAPERHQRVLAGFGFATGGEHAGGGIAGAAAGGRALEDVNLRSPRRQSPGDAKAHHPGADDGDLGRVAEACGTGRHVAAPFAGMTQTGSMGLISAAIPRHPRRLHNGHFGEALQARCQVRGVCREDMAHADFGLLTAAMPQVPRTHDGNHNDHR